MPSPHPVSSSDVASAARFTHEGTARASTTLASTDRILVATDGERPSTAAIRLVADLAHRTGSRVELLVVIDRMSLGVPEGEMSPAALEENALIQGTLLEKVRDQLRAVPAASTWVVRSEFGRPASTIARIAKERRAKMIVVGLGDHSVFATLVGAETALRVLRRSDVPLLAVHPRAQQLPTSVVVGMDFGSSSIRAAHMARMLVATPGSLHLVHVRAVAEHPDIDRSAWDDIYAAGVRDAFARVVADLAPNGEVSVSTEIVRGLVGESLIRAAERHGAGLIATGTHSHSVVERLLIGMTPTVIIRALRTSVLVAPPELDETE